MAHILVIDDEEGIRELLRIFLERDGHSISEAGDGDAGLRMLKAQTFDLVITDIVMPNKEGIETIIEARRLNPDIKIIAISGGSAGGDYLRAAGRLGADLIFSKPISSATLTKAVRELVG